MRGAAVGGLAVAAPTGWMDVAKAVVPVGAVPFTRPLPVPPILDMTAGGAFNLVMTNAVHDFYAGSSTDVFGYRVANASGEPVSAAGVLGPTLVARRGVPVTLTVKNSLGAHPVADAIDTGIPGATNADRATPRAVVHLHGGHTSEADDGSPDPQYVIANGASRTYHYGNLQQSAGLWYHDHALGITRLNVYAGLAAGYLIRDADDDGEKLPAGPPYEVPLIIQDRMFRTDGKLAYPTDPAPTARPWAPEFFGDVATVNGEAWPVLEVERSMYRFRVYNGSQSRFYKFGLVTTKGTKLTFQQIGTDGGLLDAPVPTTGLVLGPGERADLVVDFAPLPLGTRVRLANNARTPYPDGPRRPNEGGVPLPTIMQFVVTRKAGPDAFTGPLPTSLRSVPITRLAGRPVAAVRNMALLEVLDDADEPVMGLINDRPFGDASTGLLDGSYKAITHGADTLEQWNIINLTADAHPIHVHLVQGQLLDRQRVDVEAYLAVNYPGLPLDGNQFQSDYAADGSSPSPDPTAYLLGGPRRPLANERGWKDTFVAMPGEVTRLLLPLGAGAAPGAPMAVDPPPGGPYRGDFVWHCHILEHEENDMMQQYRVG